MQKIVLFIEQNVDACISSHQIGILFLNRFAVDEEAANEILPILEFQKIEIQKEYLDRQDQQLKEMNDLEIIDAGVKSVSYYEKNELMPHLIYCGEFYFDSQCLLEEMIVSRMRQYEIESSLLTYVSAHRINLITQEKCKLAYEGKLKNDKNWRDYERSINDDLEKFFNNQRNLQEIKKEFVRSFFTPKLTQEELKLVEEKNKSHMYTYIYGFHADIDIEEMKKSDSKGKYVHASCIRRSICLNS